MRCDVVGLVSFLESRICGAPYLTCVSCVVHKSFEVKFLSLEDMLTAVKCQDSMSVHSNLNLILCKHSNFMLF